VNHNRIARLERLARESPCRVCGRTHALPDPSTPEPNWERLSANEWDELVQLLGAAMPTPCQRCRRADPDFRRMTNDQLIRALQLFDVLVVDPAGGSVAQPPPPYKLVCGTDPVDLV
jgi:hypothetical protein